MATPGAGRAPHLGSITKPNTSPLTLWPPSPLARLSSATPNLKVGSLRWCKESETAENQWENPGKNHTKSAKPALSSFLPPVLYPHRIFWPNITWMSQTGRTPGRRKAKARQSQWASNPAGQTCLSASESLWHNILDKTTRGTKATLPHWLFPAVLFYYQIDWLCWPQLFFLYK